MVTKCKVCVAGDVIEPWGEGGSFQGCFWQKWGSSDNVSMLNFVHLIVFQMFLFLATP